MKTTLYLVRHAATPNNLAQPPRLQGRKQNPPLARLGVRQAELTRDFLALRCLEHCYCSPLLRAVQTATIIATPHGVSPQIIEDLNECDIGIWEGLDWQEIRYLHAEDYRRFMENPARHGYPGGESFADVYERTQHAIEGLFQKHPGESMLVVAHHIVNRTYLAGLLGLGPERARQVSLDNCGISVVVREDNKTIVTTLNATFHLQGAAAA